MINKTCLLLFRSDIYIFVLKGSWCYKLIDNIFTRTDYETVTRIIVLLTTFLITLSKLFERFPTFQFFDNFSEKSIFILLGLNSFIV